MKRSRFVALVLAAAIMLMGAGYAAWSDTITVRSSVSTGYLDVDFVNDSQYNFVEGTDRHLTDADGYELHESYVGEGSKIKVTARDSADDVTGEQLPNNDKAEVSLLNFYPGASASATMRFRNNGTIPVLFDSIGVDIEELGNDAKFFKCSVAMFDPEKFTDWWDWDYVDIFGEHGIENIKLVENVRLDELEDDLNEVLEERGWWIFDQVDLKGDTVGIGKEVVLVIDIAADDYTEDGTVVTMTENANNKYNFNLDIVFGQYNK